MSATICSSDDVKEVGIDQGGLDDRGMGGLISGGAEVFLIFTASRPACVQWTVGVLSPKQNGGSVKLTGHLRLMPLLRMLGAIPPLSIMFLWRGV